MKKTILLIHESSHIGGGQTYFDGLTKGFQLAGYVVEHLQDVKDIQILRALLKSKAKYVVWNIYSEFPLWIYLSSFLMGKKNVFVIYGIWHLESVSTYWRNSSLKSLIKQKIQNKLFLIRQYSFALFSDGIYHLILYSKSLFFHSFFFPTLRFKKHSIIGVG